MAASITPPMTKDALVAQLDRALPSEGRGHRFESCRVHHFFKFQTKVQAPNPRAKGQAPSPKPRTQGPHILSRDILRTNSARGIWVRRRMHWAANFPKNQTPCHGGIAPQPIPHPALGHDTFCVSPTIFNSSLCSLVTAGAIKV